MKNINFTLWLLVVFSASATAGPIEDRFADRITCAIHGAGYVLNGEDGDPSNDVQCSELVFQLPEKVITSNITQDTMNDMYRNADAISVTLDYRNSAGELPVSYHASKCSDMNMPGDFTSGRLNSAEHRASTCLVDVNHRVAQSSESRSPVPSKLLVSKNEFRPIAEFFAQDHGHVYSDIQKNFGWASDRVSWENVGEKYHTPEIPARAYREFLMGFDGNEYSTISHRYKKKDNGPWLVERDRVRVDTSKKMCLDLGTFKYAATGVFSDRPDRHWYVPGKSNYSINGGINPKNMPFTPASYKFLTPNASYVYSNQIENHRNRHNKSGAVFRKRHFYCIDGTEGVDIYSRDESTNTCSLQSLPSFSDAGIANATYQCNYRKHKRIYEGETRLVPVQVGDITTFIPYLHYDNPIKSTRLDSAIYYPNIPVVEGVAYMYCDAAGSGTGTTNNSTGSCASLVGSGKHCIASKTDFTTDTSGGNIQLSQSIPSGKGLQDYCKPGSPLVIRNKFVNASGSALPYGLAEEYTNSISYPTQSATALEWAYAIEYYSTYVSLLSNSLKSLSDVYAGGIGSELDKTKLLCEMSHALFETAENSDDDVGLEFYTENDAEFPQACKDDLSVTNRGYWIHTNSPEFLASDHLNKDGPKHHNALIDVLGVEEQIRSIQYVHDNLSPDQTVDSALSDTTKKLNDYLSDVVGEFIVTANAYADRQEGEACRLMNVALAEMIEALDGHGNEVTEIPTINALNCSQ